MTAADLNIATVWEAVADEIPGAQAVVHGGATLSWAEFDDQAARFSGALAEMGVGHDDKVALYLFNDPEYLVAQYASFKRRAIPVNVNYRYLADELLYLLENSDAKVVVFDASLSDRIDEVRHRAPGLTGLVQVGGGELLDGAHHFADLVAASEPDPRQERSGDDLWFLYTGGTTGMPKGVMWAHRDLVALSEANYRPLGFTVPTTAEEAGETARLVHEADKVTRMLPAAPLMHGTAMISALMALNVGGCITTLTARSFDADELWRCVQEHGVTTTSIVGDAFATPMVAALVAARDRGEPYDVSSLGVVMSSGLMWSAPVKDALLEWGDFALVDLLGSSEGIGIGRSVTTRRRTGGRTGRFRLGEHAQVFTADGRQVEPGSGEQGLLAVGGPIPLGYYKDPEKTAATFRQFAGRRWSVPGDHATVEEDGTITLLGRGSNVINTGGEKVYPEEVEEAVKTHPSVADCNAVGVADERWGQAVTVVVSLHGGSSATAQEITAHVKERLASYKSPKRVVFVPRLQRAPNGKSDYAWARAVAQGTGPDAGDPDAGGPEVGGPVVPSPDSAHEGG